jgi:N4-gp56 family major capsid protein
MSLTTITSGTNVSAKQWSDKLLAEYMGKTFFKPYMGSTEQDAQGSIIYVKEELTKKKGDIVNIPLVEGLDGSGVEGDSTLEDNEEQMNFYSQNVTLTQYRNAVRDAGALNRQRPAFDLFQQFRPQLTGWMARKFDALVIAALQSIAGTAYASADATARDAWLVSNSDRVLFGAATANYSGDHDVDLAKVDSTTDIFIPAQISLAKRMALLATPKIKPYRLENGLETFVLFAHPYCVRDLKNNSTFQNAQRDALPRGLDNPLFTGAVGYWDGVLIVECDKIPLLDNVGASSIDVAANFLCGAQAVVMAQGAYEGGMRVDFAEETFDYGNQKGMAIMSMMKLEKGYFNSKDHGLVTTFSAAVGD